VRPLSSEHHWADYISQVRVTHWWYSFVGHTAELRDTDLMPHLLRPNPHRPTYSNMMLFLRCQVEAFAFSDAKWGSPEALDAEFERREAEKKDKKSKKFAKKLSELRKKTRTNVWHRRQEAEHKHEFEQVAATDGSGGTVQRCAECGFQIDVESF
jgi:DNA-repair protein complementing XP-A cells